MKNLLTLVLVFSTFLTYAQEKLTVVDNWTVTKDLELVTISQRIVNVSDEKNGIFKEYVQYKFKNKTNKQVFINWDFELKYSNSDKVHTNSGELYRATVLQPHQDFIPTYNLSNQKSFFVFNKFLKSTTNVQLEYANFKNLSVKTL